MQRFESPHLVVGVSLVARWLPQCLVLLMAACMPGLQAAVPESCPAAAQPTTHCGETPSARAALQRVAQELQLQGMALQATCAAAGGGWMVQVRVVNGMKARKVVRGPLADGHDVGMGTPAGGALAGAGSAAQGFSPDVLHNRAWLRATMARHQWENSPDAWWRFALRGAAPLSPPGAGLAVR